MHQTDTKNTPTRVRKLAQNSKTYFGAEVFGGSAAPPRSARGPRGPPRAPEAREAAPFQAADYSCSSAEGPFGSSGVLEEPD